MDIIYAFSYSIIPGYPRVCISLVKMETKTSEEKVLEMGKRGKTCYEVSHLQGIMIYGYHRY